MERMDCSRARTKDPTEWLETVPDFSWRLVEQFREWILTWEPDLTESIKWNMLCFSGRKLICGLSGCQKHLGITFFRGVELPDPAHLFSHVSETAATLTIRVTSADGFNREAFRVLLHEAVMLDDEPTLARPRGARRPPPQLPDFFAARLAQKQHRNAAARFRQLAPSRQREYIQWLLNAKRPETRARRLTETLAALANGRHWDDRKLVPEPRRARGDD